MFLSPKIFYDPQVCQILRKFSTLRVPEFSAGSGGEMYLASQKEKTGYPPLLENSFSGEISSKRATKRDV